jgi:hypothetical protein
MDKKEKFERLIRLGKHFIKTLKTDGLYNQFLMKYGKTSKETPSISNTNGALFEAMMKDVVSLVKMDLHHKGKDLDNLNDDYEYYTNILNMLLHKYVEKGMHIHPERCAKLGEKIFNSFCIETFGEEKFKKDMDDFNASRRMMMDEVSIDSLQERYTKLCQMGMRISWEDFYRIHMEMLTHQRMKSEMPRMSSDMFYINDDHIQFDLETEQDEDMPF